MKDTNNYGKSFQERLAEAEERWKNATISDIVAAKRREADSIEASARGSLKAGEDYDGIAFTESVLESALDFAETKRNEADRLEAALKRELSKNVSKNGADFGQLGNAAKLREALGKIRAEIWNNTIIAGKRKFELYEIADAALAAPPRNCDKYATADEALKAQEQMFNDSNFANGECKLGCPECDNPRVGCKIAWLFAPATEKEGGAK